MEHTFNHKVFYSDTDAYGVVWHGSYLRWLEMGRVYICEDLGLDLVTLKEHDVLIPVTNLNVRYKASAKLNDNLEILTRISKVTPISITFSQAIVNAETKKTYIQAEIDVVAVNNDGKLYRRLPDVLKSACEKALEEAELCNV